VQLLVELRLPFGKLDRYSQLVLLRLHYRIGALALGYRHVRPELSDVVIVFHPLEQEPTIDGDHRGQR